MTTVGSNWKKKAIEVGGESARSALRKDDRFGPFRQSPEFQTLASFVQPFNRNRPPLLNL